MEKLQEKIGYTFKDGALLAEALTHSSYANECAGGCRYNERLEFLGDSVLSVVVSDWLFAKRPELPEGELTRTRAALVCEGKLCEFARAIDLGAYMRFGRGELMSGGAQRASVLADCFEALIAAIYLDGGMPAAARFIHSFVDKDHPDARDYKTELQEIVQQNKGERLRYVVTGTSGPEHDMTFEIDVMLNSNVIGHGSGHSKKAAQQQAACEALRLMGL